MIERERELTRSRVVGMAFAPMAQRSPWIVGRYRAGFQIVAERETHQHADRGGERHRNQQTDEAEQIAEGEQREHQPDRMQADASPTSLGDST